MSANVVALSKSTQLLLAGSVPYGEANGPMGGEEGDGADFDSLCGDVLLFKLSGDMAFNEGSFAHASVSNEYNFELCDDIFLSRIGVTCMFEAAILSNDIDYCRS
jgi:hypothetical protein